MIRDFLVHRILQVPSHYPASPRILLLSRKSGSSKIRGDAGDKMRGNTRCPVETRSMTATIPSWEEKEKRDKFAILKVKMNVGRRSTCTHRVIGGGGWYSWGANRLVYQHILINIFSIKVVHDKLKACLRLARHNNNYANWIPSTCTYRLME